MIKTGGKSIVLTGGGTAGHVLPHFALLPHLKKHFSHIYYIGSKDGIEKNLVEREGISFFSVTCVKLRRSLSLKNLAIPFGLLKGVREARKIIKTLKPDVVFSKGGFVAYPVVRAASKLGIPVVAHESDFSMGLANKMAAKFCVSVCTTFKETARRGGKLIHTGSPVRDKIYNGNKEVVVKCHGLSGKLQNLLVFGGSLGAAVINRVVMDAAPVLLNNWNIIHICGKGKASVVGFERGEAALAGVNGSKFKGTADSGVVGKYVQLEYVQDIENYFAWADVAVSRAGSNALCELMVLSKPTLFVPLATGRGDQIENAREVLRLNAGGVLFEEMFDKELLIKGIEEVWRNRELYKENARKVVTDGTKKIADTIYGVL